MTAPCIGLLVPYAESDAAIMCQLYKLPTAEYKVKIAEDGLEKLNKVIETERRRADSLDLIVKDSLDEKWYESTTFWFLAGALSTVLIVITVDGVRSM